jgi:hypothetical protein
MRGTLALFNLFLLVSCSTSPTTFVLQDPGKEKYYLSDSIKKAFRKGHIDKSPFIAIDGVEFKYHVGSDTVTLPLNKNEILAIGFLNKNSSQFIYGENARSGAVIINTTVLRQYTSDTSRNK